MTEASPAVDVVIPTRDRPDFVRAAIASVRSQDYGGELRVFVVFDEEEPDESLAADGNVPVTVLRNQRKPGLCGARNTGIAAGSAELVAFLDDDDRWLPGKLTRQVARMQQQPEAVMATTSVRVEFGEKRTVRLAGVDTVSHRQLLDSRMSMLHSSTFLFRRSALEGEYGLVDEAAPRSQNEDWDLLLRYSVHVPIAHLDEPLVAVRRGVTSKFSFDWGSKLAAVRWVLEQHPDFRTSPVGHGLLLGQIAFAQAALGQRRAALRTIGQCLRVRWREPRAYLALLPVLGISPSVVLAALQRRGRGI